METLDANPTHQPTLNSSPTNLNLSHLLQKAETLRSQQNYHLALTHYTQCLQIQLHNLGPTHPDTLSTLHMCAELHRVLYQYSQSEHLLTECHSRRKLIFGETHPSTLESLELLGEVLRMQGKYGDAEVVYSYAVRIRSGVYGRDHETTVSILSMLAEVLRMQGKYEQAEPLYVEVHLKVGSLEAGSNVEEVRRMIRQNSQQNGDVKEDVEQKLKDRKDMLGIVNNVSSLLRSLPFSFKNG